MSRTRPSNALAMPSRTGSAGFLEKSGGLRSASLVLLVLVATVAGSAQTFNSLASFNYTDGEAPRTTLIQGADGDFYGTTYAGGSHASGTVFKITPGGTLTTIYNFCAKKSCADGSAPSAGLVLATNGYFYGTASSGGAHNYGTVFRISSAGLLTTVHSFAGPDGAYPQTALIQAANGSLYGTTNSGGNGSNGNTGTFFSITTSGKFTSLYTFCPAGNNCSDGFAPSAVTQGPNGNFYGTTYGGGLDSCRGGGAAFEITAAGQLTVLFSFCSPNFVDGFYPDSTLIQASNGNLYGTTAAGGANCAAQNGCGTIFEITSAGVFNSLYSFCALSNCTDGSYPQASLIQATDGNLYGTTWGGGAGSTGGSTGTGTVFEITSTGQLTTLYTFAGTDGMNPDGPVLQATDGNFYGTTYYGGSGQGTVFSLSAGLTPFVQPLTTSGKVGKKVILLGTNLTGSTAVSFNGKAALTFAVVSATEMSATVPSGATTGPIKVTTPGGILGSNVAFQVIPQVKTFAPNSGPVGAQVKISGLSLTGASAVTFGGVAATVFTVNSDKLVTVTVPTGAVTGPISITTPGGTGTSATSFTVN